MNNDNNNLNGFPSTSQQNSMFINPNLLDTLEQSNELNADANLVNNQGENGEPNLDIVTNPQSAGEQSMFDLDSVPVIGDNGQIDVSSELPQVEVPQPVVEQNDIDLEKTVVMSPIIDSQPIVPQPVVEQSVNPVLPQVDVPQPVLETNVEVPQPVVEQSVNPVLPQVDVPQPVLETNVEVPQPVVEQSVNPVLPQVDVPQPVLETSVEVPQPVVEQSVNPVLPQVDVPQPVLETSVEVPQPVVEQSVNPVLPQVDVPQPVLETSVEVPQPVVEQSVNPVLPQTEVSQQPNLLFTMPAVIGSNVNNDLNINSNNDFTQTNNQIPQVDPMTQVGMQDFSGVQPTINQPEPQSEIQSQPDLLFSNNVQPEPIPQPDLGIPMPIPMDNNSMGMLNNQSEPYQESINNSVEDDRLFRAFVGDKYYEVGRHRFFNIWGFIFGGTYLVYRKMYLLGILVIIIQNVLSIYLHELLVFLIVGGVIGLFFNIFYTMHVNNKIKDIKRRYNGNLESICRAKGGTSFINMILFFIMYSIILIVLTVALGVKTIVTKVIDGLEINLNNFGMVGSVTDEYDGHVEYYIGKFKVFMNNTDPEPGVEPEISDKELLKVVMPRAKQETDYVSCTLDNRTQGWHNTVGYLFKPGSTDCKSYMENAEAYISNDMYPFPDSAILIFNAKKELGPGTKLDYKDSSCMYDEAKGKFICRKK